ncbi:MAG: hypothetical protein HC941_27035 [Microcoleus sp. SU_5_3]|nr:hypothetical protein [Microcoleus sp. SU_5_3]NJL69908.1 hypothetical protein [Microcoleus sp. SM1_3_4]
MNHQIKARSLCLLSTKGDRSFFMKRSIALLASKGRSLFWYGKGDRSFAIERSIALLAWKGRSLFLVWKGRSPLWNQSKRAIALNSYFSTKVDRYLRCWQRNIPGLIWWQFFQGDRNPLFESGF